MTSPKYGHVAAPSQAEPWRERSTCAECGRPVVKVRASGSKRERWQHS